MRKIIGWNHHSYRLQFLREEGGYKKPTTTDSGVITGWDMRKNSSKCHTAQADVQYALIKN